MAFLAALAVLHGIVVNLVPALVTTLSDEFHLSGKQQGGLGSSFFGASVLVLVVSGPVARMLGVRIMGLLCGGLAGAGACALAAATNYPLALGAVSLLALGMAPIPTVYALVIARQFVATSQRLFMWIYALMAASATVATSSLGGLIDWFGDYRTVLGVLGLLIWCGTAAVLALTWRSLDLANGATPDLDPLRAKRPPALAPTGTQQSAWSVFTHAALYLLALMMICDFLCATTIVTWIARYFEETYGDRRLFGGSALSAMSAGVCLGRIGMGCLPPGRVPDRWLLAASYLIGTGCFLAIIVWQPPFAGSLVLMALSGAMFAAQSPAMSSLAVKQFGGLAPVAIPLYEAVGNVAGVAGPWLLGGLLDAGTELGTALFVPPAAGIVLAVVAIGWEWVDRRSGTPLAVRESSSPLEVS